MKKYSVVLLLLISILVNAQKFDKIETKTGISYLNIGFEGPIKTFIKSDTIPVIMVLIDTAQSYFNSTSFNIEASIYRNEVWWIKGYRIMEKEYYFTDSSRVYYGPYELSVANNKYLWADLKPVDCNKFLVLFDFNRKKEIPPTTNITDSSPPPITLGCFGVDQWRF